MYRLISDRAGAAPRLSPGKIGSIVLLIFTLLALAGPGALGAEETTRPTAQLTGPPAEEDRPNTLENRVNAVWVLMASLPVYLMHGGFGFFEAGMTRRKSTVTTLTHNLMVLAVTVMVFWGVGFGLMYGDGPPWIGMTGFAPQLLHDPNPLFPTLVHRPLPLVVAFVFVLSYADTPATLVAGSCAERLKLSGFVIITAIVGAVLFPLLARWVIVSQVFSFRGAPAFDTGAGYIQLCGGCFALASSTLLGPRTGRFGPDGKVHSIPSHSMPLVFLGAFILWMGFLSFNMAFAMVAERSAGLVLTNTVLGSMAGACTALMSVWLLRGKGNLRASVMGMLTACVAITSAAGVVMPWAAVVIGAVSGLIAPPIIALWPRIGIDDPTEYLTMNFAGGIVGMLAVGVFASPTVVAEYGSKPVTQAGLIYGGGAQMVAQLIAAGVIVVFSTISCGLIVLVLKVCNLLRVDLDEEKAGSDRLAHGEVAYSGFAWPRKDDWAEGEDIEEVPEFPDSSKPH